MSPHFQRGHLLYQQERFDQAAAEFQSALAQEPDNAFYHAMLASALLRQGRVQGALESAQTAVAKDPESAFGHWTLATVFLERGELKQAEAALETAIELDPADADACGLLARIHFDRNRHQDALAAAERGLALDPKNDLCLTFRSRALLALGRTEEAHADAETLLAEAPDDAWNHCLRGEQLLHEGAHEQARAHFIEALRIDPRNEGARQGLATALKARNPLYGIILSSLLRLDRYREWSLWLVVILVFVGIRLGNAWVNQRPDWIVPYEVVKALLWGFAILIFIANPIFNLLLRFNREGRHALSEDEVRATNWYLACFGFAALCGAWAFTARTGVFPASIGLTALFLTAAVTAVFESTPGYVRRRMAAFTIAAGTLLVLTPVLLIASLFTLVALKRVEAAVLLRAVLLIPAALMLFAAFAGNIRNVLERKRPDHS